MGVPLEVLSEEHLRGTVKEMLNMLSGSTLSIYDHASVFDLGIPRQITALEAQSDLSNGHNSIAVVINTHESRIGYQLLTR